MMSMSIVRALAVALLWTWPLAAGDAGGDGKEATAAQAKNQARIESARKLIRGKQYDAAAVLLQSVLDELPDNDGLYLQALCERAYAMEQLKKVPEALESYNLCLDLLGQAEADPANRKLTERCKKAILRLDKSRRIILRYAAQLEREAKRFKGKDEYAYGKLTEVVEYMQGMWRKDKEKKKETGDKAVKKRITQRHSSFFEDLAAGRMEQAIAYVDPQIRKYAGDATILGYLRTMEGMLKIAGAKKGSFSMREIKLGSDRKSARIIGRMRTRFEVKDMDPEYWVLREGKWYLGDKEKLKDFK